MVSRPNAARRPLWAGPSATGTATAALPASTLGVDGELPAAAAVYSHWQSAQVTPPELVADTSTEILCNAAGEAERWLDPFTHVAIDHLDADGLLSVMVACRPELVVHRDLLVGAAAAGDFNAWPGAAPFRLMLTLHQHLRAARTLGGVWEQQVLDQVVDVADALIANSQTPDPERDAQIAQVLSVRAALSSRHAAAGTDAVSYRLDIGQRVALVSWGERLGRAPDDYTAVHAPDDLPLWALSGLIPDSRFQLLAMTSAHGTAFQLDAPRHSWARTVRRPHVPWPDLTALAATLTAADSCAWVARPRAAEFGFTCILAATARSRLPIDTVLREVTAELA